MTWVPDVLDGFEQTTLTLPDALDGPVEVVVVRKRTSLTTTAGVLYVHGFVDYFFQTHLADFYEQQGLRFYAVDLRRHGRSLRDHQQPNTIRDIDELLADVTAALGVMADDGIDWTLLNGHSTGGLVAVVFAARGVGREHVDAVLLNSPFLDMNLPAWQERILEPVLAAVGKVAPGLKLPGLSTVYGESMHVSHHGDWDFDQRWKPVAGFPTRAGWFRAIHLAQAEVEQGLHIDVPVLLLHAARSAWPKQWAPDVATADIVLDVADMQRLGPGLGSKVEVAAVDGGVHDLVLSAPAAQAMTFELMAAWLGRIRA
ncbi:MAG: alpha/beta hydrolase [Ilumatobacteraceae bacterium]